MARDPVGGRGAVRRDRGDRHLRPSRPRRLLIDTPPPLVTHPRASDPYGGAHDRPRRHLLAGRPRGPPDRGRGQGRPGHCPRSPWSACPTGPSRRRASACAARSARAGSRSRPAGWSSTSRPREGAQGGLRLRPGDRPGGADRAPASCARLTGCAGWRGRRAGARRAAAAGARRAGDDGGGRPAGPGRHAGRARERRRGGARRHASPCWRRRHLNEAVAVLAGTAPVPELPEPAPAGGRCRASRPGRRARPAAGPAGGRDRGRRRPQPADDRPAGQRQDDAGAPPARAAARADAGRGARDHPDRLGGRRAGRRRRAAGPAVPGAAPQRLGGGAGGQRAAAPGRGDAWPTAACSSWTSCPSSSGRSLEALRMPLEDGEVRISRAAGSVLMPARCQLVAAMNPCPCGLYGDPDRECRCAPQRLAAYRTRISGPLLDRFDLRVEVPRAEAHGAPRRGRRPRSRRASALARQLLARAAGRRLGDEAEALLGQAADAAGSSAAAASTARCGWRRRSPPCRARPRSRADHLAEALSYRDGSLRVSACSAGAGRAIRGGCCELHDPPAELHRAAAAPSCWRGSGRWSPIVGSRRAGDAGLGLAARAGPGGGRRRRAGRQRPGAGRRRRRARGRAGRRRARRSAVLGCGADVAYPRTQPRALRADRWRAGLIVSEYPAPAPSPRPGASRPATG